MAGQNLDDTKSFRLQERDVLIVDAVHRLRVLTTEQIGSLFFPTASGWVSTSCRSRLRHLVLAGYLERGEQLQTKTEGRRSSLFMLTQQGADLLVQELGYDEEDVDWRPAYNTVKWPFLRHQLAINDAHIAFSGAATDLDWWISQWLDDRILKRRHVNRVLVPESGREVAVVPDAYFILAGDGGSTTLHFFLEVDRATMTVVGSSPRVKSWQDKIRAYQAYFSSDQIGERYGTHRIRVLTITSGKQRLRHLKAATEAVGGRNRYWFTTGADLSRRSALVEPIWHKATSDSPLRLLERV